MVKEDKDSSVAGIIRILQETGNPIRRRRQKQLRLSPGKENPNP